MRRLARAGWFLVCILSLFIAVPVVLSERLRSDYVLTLYRKLAWLWPQEYALVGDSLALDCPWPRAFGKPGSTIVLAQGGKGIREAAQQIVLSRSLRAKYVFIAVGINDILLVHAPADQVARDFNYLLDTLDATQAALVSLIPYVSDAGLAPAIDAANAVIAGLAGQRGIPVVDLNAVLASKDGVRNSEMTYDGVHFSLRACELWIDAVKAQISRMQEQSIRRGS
jgi:lysophospholipase L1-like esterase